MSEGTPGEAAKQEFEHAFGFHTVRVPKHEWFARGMELPRRPKTLCKRCLTSPLNAYDIERTICRICELDLRRQESALANMWRYSDRYWDAMPEGATKNRARRQMRKFMLLQMLECFSDASGVYEGSWEKAFEVYDRTGNHDHVRDLWGDLVAEGYIEHIGCRVRVVDKDRGEEFVRVTPASGGLWRKMGKEFVAPDEEEVFGEEVAV